MPAGNFQTRRLPSDPDEQAPDGSAVRRLCRTGRGSLVHVSIATGQVSRAVRHRTVEELWYFLEGRGELWRQLGDEADVVPVFSGIAITLPVGAAFQLRSLGTQALTAVCVTLPPWPGDDEAEYVDGPWSSTDAPCD